MHLLFLTALAAAVALGSPAPDSESKPRFPSRAERQVQQQHDHVLQLPLRRRAPTHVMAMGREADDRKTQTSSAHTAAPTPNKSNLTTMFQDVAYGIKLWIGNPEQSVVLDFDTGSSETWVDPPCTMMEGAGAYEDLCRSLGVYIPQQSDTSFATNGTCPPGWITYGSGATYVKYYRDVVQFADPYDVSSIGNNFKLRKPVQFGLSTWAEGMVSGIFGAAYGVGYNQNYSGFIDEIYDQGLVKDKDFSISLGSVNEENGEVVFGGIDLNKFVGPLHRLPLSSQLSRQADGYFRYWINVTSISITQPGSCVSTPITNATFSERFLPDTGTTLTYMPEDTFYGLLSYFPDAEPVPSYGYVLSCAHLYDEGYVSFGFDGITIHVPYNQFIFQLPPIFADEKETICILGAVPSNSFFILGDTFLRGAYALFRQQEHKIYLAQYTDCGTHVVSSHGNLTGVVGNCGRHHSQQDEDPDSGDDEPYGSYTPPSEPSAVSITGFGTCTSFTAGTYTPFYTATADGDDPIRAMSMFPRPAIQTAGGHRGKPVPTTTIDMAGHSSATPTATGSDDVSVWIPDPTPTDCSIDAISLDTVSEPGSNRTTILSTISDFLPTTTLDRTPLDATPTVITIPVETGETVIVKMASTTYTVVDGVTQSHDSQPSPIASSSRRASSQGTISHGLHTGSWATHTGTETAHWSNSSALHSKSATSVTASITPAEATTTEDVDGYITTWAWTPEDDTTIPEPTDFPSNKRKRVDQQRPAKGQDCERTPCLRAMMERRNTVRAKVFCRQVVRGEQEEDGSDLRETTVPGFIQGACLAGGMGHDTIKTACGCLVGRPGEAEA